METFFDSRKDAANVLKHGVSLSRAREFDFATCYLTPDRSQDYGEERWIAVGWIDSQLYNLVLIFGDGAIRPISLRKANRAEQEQYAENY